MNTRLKMALLLHSGESGFALVIAVALGLIMILVGLSMTLRSQGDQIVASSQKATERSLAAAEKGVAYYQAFLNANRLLPRYPDCAGTRNSSGTCPDSGSTQSWTNVTSVPGMNTTSCVGNTTSTTTIQNQYATTAWQQVDSNDSTKGQFRLVSYKIANGGDPGAFRTGILTVEGRVTNPNANSAANKSISRVQVSILINPPSINNVPVPGVWISNPTDTNGTGNNTIRGNVIVNSCSSNLANIRIDPTTPQYSAQRTNLPMPTVPSMPANEANYTRTPIVRGYHALGTINTDLTLPRPGDQTVQFNGQQRYVYTATDIVRGAGSTTLTITPGQRVVIFLSGNIDKNVEINHTCGSVAGCLPTNFQIFGTKASGGQICLNGNRVVDAFILAPNYEAGVAGGGSGGGINGSIWVRNWNNSDSCGSNSNNVVVRQAANWSELTGLIPQNDLLPLSIKPLRAWQRNTVN